MSNAVVVSYTMPWKKNVDLSRRLLYPTKFFFVVREEADKNKIQVDAPSLGADELQPIPLDGQMQNRIVKTVGQPMSPKPALAAGTMMSIKVSRSTNPLVWAFIALVGLLCVFVPGVLMWNRKKPTNKYSTGKQKSEEPQGGASVYSVNPHSSGGVASNGAEAEVRVDNSFRVKEVVEKLAALDDDWEAGRLTQAAYESQRAQWKEEVVALMSQSQRR
jgi:hypothetical protein